MTQFDPPQPPPTYPVNTGPTEGTSGLAIAAMVVGILAFLTSCFAIGAIVGLVALILGVVALSNISAAGNRQGGKGFAIAGTVLGGVSMVAGFFAVVAMLLPALGAARRTARQMQNNTQVRGIHQSFVMYAQGNQSNYPGMTGRGDATTVTDATVSGRLQVLLDGNYFTPEYLISPSETLPAGAPGVPLNAQNYSYALLDITTPGGRRDEWRETLNTEAVALSDRNAGTARDVYSIHTEPSGGWRGSVAYNDNHVVFEPNHVLATKYSTGAPNPSDDLFAPAGAYDAYMVHTIEGEAAASNDLLPR